MQQLSRRLGIPPEQAQEALSRYVSALQQRIEEQGSAVVPGLGTFRRFRGSVAFEPSDALALAVNHKYAGLEEVVIESAGGGSPTPPAAAPEPPAAAEDAPQAGPPAFEEPTPAAEPLRPEALTAETEPLPEAALPPVYAAPLPEAEDEAPPSEPEVSAWEEHPVFAIDEFGAPPSAEAAPPDTYAPPAAVYATPADADAPPPLAAAPDEDADRLHQEWVARAHRHVRPEQPARRFSTPVMVASLLLIAALAALLYTYLRPGDPLPPPATINAPVASALDPAAEDTTAEVGQVAAAETEPVQEPDNTAAEPPAPAVAAQTPATGYAIVAGSSVDRPLAEGDVARYKKAGMPAWLLQSQVNGRTRYRIMVGQYPTRGEASRGLGEYAGQLPEGAWVAPLEANNP